MQAFLTISNFLNKTTIMTTENFQPLEYCEKLCHFTSTYNDLDTLNVFIDSIRVCILSFKSMINIVLKYIKLTSFFDGIEKVSILEAAIKLVLALMPPPSNDIIELFPKDEFKWTDSSISDDLIIQIKAVIPFICQLYCNTLSLSKLCIQTLTIFVNSKSFQFPLSNQIIYMMHINLADDTFSPYILAIVNRCLKTNSNLEAILRTKLIERIAEKQLNNSSYCEKIIAEILPFSTSSPYSNNKIEFSTIDELILLIEQGQFSPYDLFASYIHLSKKSINSIKLIKKIIKKLPDIDSIYKKCQFLVNFLIQIMSEIPILMTCTDPYYPDYSKLNDEVIDIHPSDNNFEAKQIPFYSILSEMSENLNSRASEIEKLINESPDLRDIFDRSTLNHINRYAYNALYRELSDKKNKTISLNDVTINDTDQFVISILPQILSAVVDDPTKPLNSIDLKKLISQEFTLKNEKKIKFSKRNSMAFNLKFLKGGEIVKEILDILKLIYEKDQKHKINFVYEPFTKRFESQKKFFFLLITLYSPYAQLMVKYPFLFKMDDRLFLFKLLTLEPLIAREYFYKKMNPKNALKKLEPFSKIKFIVEREEMFKQGITILEHFAKYPSFLEVSFRGDVGYGTGTTSQFFDKMSSEFCKKRHRLWRRDNIGDKNSIYAMNKQGLFPYATANSHYMRALGLFVAKAIQNDEVIDIPFNPSFFDLAAGRRVSLYDVDEEYARSLYNEYTEKVAIEDEWKFTINIESYAEPFNIVKNGKNITVTHENFVGYLRSMEDYICGKYVKRKIDCFINGFVQVLDPSFLKMFTGEELIKILNGKQEKLTIDSISNCIQADIGYEGNSDQIKNLKEIIADFGFEYQKFFIKNVTGLSCLPYGGLEMLDPPITVSRREVHDKKYKDEDCWPSARTCIHKLFLPPYKTKEQMRENIIKAITDPAFRESFGIT